MKVAETWGGAAPAELAERWGLAAVHLFESVGSTNDVARSLAAGGAPPGTLVLAERQDAGRGRAGRAWVSSPGLGLWISLVTRPARAESSSILPLLSGIAVARALDRLVSPAVVGLKWPNDLLLGGGKFGGILCEGTWDGVSPGWVVVGVGLNLLHGMDDFPPEIRATATSLRLATGWRGSRLEVADAVVPALHAALEHEPPRDGELVSELQDRDVLRGEHLTVADPVTGAEVAAGTGLGIAPDGALLLRSGSGAVRRVRSGTVRLVGRSARAPVVDRGEPR